jgi:hypothetical protein
MIAALLVALVLGALASYALVGRIAAPGTLAGGYFLGFGVLAVSAAGFQAVTAPWAVAITVAVAAGLLLAPLRGRPRGPFSAAVRMTAGLVMAAGVVRWLVPVAADLSSLDARVLAVAVIGAGAVWAAGQRATWLRTAFGLCLAAAVLLLIAGVAAGAPGTLASPLVPPDISPAPGLGWLLLVVLFGIQHPAPSRSPVAVAVLAITLLAGLLGLISLLGGALTFPSTGLYTVAGYASTGSGVAGAVLAVVVVAIATVAIGMTMRGVLAPWEGTPAPFPRLSGPGWRFSLVAILVGLLSFAPVPTALLVGLPALFGVAALLFDLRAGSGPKPLKPKVVYQPPAS